jgi:hypothetical protein
MLLTDGYITAMIVSKKAWKTRIDTLPSASAGYLPNGLELENFLPKSRDARLEKIGSTYQNDKFIFVAARLRRDVEKILSIVGSLQMK